MAFPLPAAFLQGAAIIESLQGAPRWDSLTISERRCAIPADDTRVLGYRGEGRRGDQRYEAICTSTWRRFGEGWRMIQHQQTPLP